MKSLRFLDRRAGYSLASIGLLLGMVVPAVFPAFVSADQQVQSRSVAMTSSAAGATGVDYTVQFTPTTDEAAGGVVLFFCSDSPIFGQACATPLGIDIGSVSLGAGTDASASIVSKSTNKIEIDDSTTGLSHLTAAKFVLHGVHNPTNATTFSTGLYARIQTYATVSDATTAYGGPTVTAGIVDDGGVAMAITSPINVTAAVRETMTFCVSGRAPTGDCGVDGGTPVTPNDPSITLGEGSPQALDSGHVSTATNFVQLSTNASSGAVVNMVNSRSCGGLARDSAATTCNIAPQTATSGTNPLIANGDALFGVEVGSSTAATDAAAPSGALSPAGSYSSSYYFMDYNSSTPTTAGVTSPYGSPFLNTGGVPLNNQQVQLTFGASAANTTPAGIYKAVLNLIATGTF